MKTAKSKALEMSKSEKKNYKKCSECGKKSMTSPCNECKTTEE